MGLRTRRGLGRRGAGGVVAALVAAALGAAALGACSASAGPSVRPPGSTAPASALAPSDGATLPTPGNSAPATIEPGGIVVTFRVAGRSDYRVRLTDPADIAIAERLLAGEEAPSIPNGRIVRGAPDVNVGYSWHIDPDDIAFADMTMEVCDGLPEYVEDGTLSGDRYCPWSAVVISIEPAP